MKGKTLNPTKSGEIYGKLKPSLPKGGMNRAQRRKLMFGRRSNVSSPQL